MPAPAILLRNLSAADIPFAMRLKALAGWNQTEADWRRFLTLEPAGCFVAEYEGQPAGTVTALSFEKKFGWIGMMLVDPERRRLGIASALLRRAVEYLEGRGVETAKLDATPLGKTVYDRHGFRDEYALERRLRPASEVRFPRSDRAIGNADSARTNLGTQLDRFAQLDTEAFGADRRVLLQSLLHAAPELCFQTNGGFVLGRAGTIAIQIGPLVATSAENAGRLLEAALAAIGYAPAILDVPVCNAAGMALLDRFGFQKQRDLIRQYRGPNRFPGDPRRVFAIAGPELG